MGGPSCCCAGSREQLFPIWEQDWERQGSQKLYGLRKGEVTKCDTAAPSPQGMGMQSQRSLCLPSPREGTPTGFCGCALLWDPTCTPGTGAYATKEGSPPWVGDANPTPSPVHPHLAALLPHHPRANSTRHCQGTHPALAVHLLWKQHNQLWCNAKKILGKKRSFSNMQGPGSYKQDFFRVPGSE